ncbi:MAG: CBS domain-containing protein [Nanoarchaeota archaeon]|nr:CBS domain-containing protein [Nanoarchaeota archaeon]
MSRFLFHGHTALERSLIDHTTPHTLFCESLESIRNGMDAIVKHTSRLPVVGTDGRMEGMLTATTLLEYLGAGTRFVEYQRHPQKLDVPIQHVMTTQIAALRSQSSLGDALVGLWKTGQHALPVVQDGKLLTMASFPHLLGALPVPGIPVAAAMSANPLHVSPDLSLIDAALLFVNTGYHRFPIVQKDVHIGMITPRDILRFVREQELYHLPEASVRDAMNRKIISFSPHENLRLAAHQMRSNHLDGVAVTDEAALQGILTTTDIAEAVLQSVDHPVVERIWTREHGRYAPPLRERPWPDPQREWDEGYTAQKHRYRLDHPQQRARRRGRYSRPKPRAH